MHQHTRARGCSHAHLRFLCVRCFDIFSNYIVRVSAQPAHAQMRCSALEKRHHRAVAIGYEPIKEKESRVQLVVDRLVQLPIIRVFVDRLHGGHILRVRRDREGLWLRPGARVTTTWPLDDMKFRSRTPVGCNTNSSSDWSCTV